MFSGKAKQDIEEKELRFSLNLENNYKKEAYQGFVVYVKAIEEHHKSGEISDKSYAKYKKKMEEYGDLLGIDLREASEEE